MRRRLVRAVSRRSAIVCVALVVAACGGSNSAQERSAWDYRFASFQPREVIFGSVDDAVSEGTSELPVPDDWQIDGTLTEVREQQGFGGFERLPDGPSVSSIISFASNALVDLDGTGVDRELGVFVDGGGRVAAQWRNESGEVITMLMEGVGTPPMVNPQLAPYLDALDDLVAEALSVTYTVAYERQWLDSTTQNPVTGVVTSGDQGETRTVHVTTDLVSTSSAITTDWVLSTDGVDDGAVSHVEYRHIDGRVFARGACTAAELEASAWLESPADRRFESLDTPGYVAALVERLENPQLAPSVAGMRAITFSLRRSGATGTPWPLWSYGDDSDIEGTLLFNDDRTPASLYIRSSRGADGTSGAASDSVAITFVAWNDELNVVVPSDVVEPPALPSSC